MTIRKRGGGGYIFRPWITVKGKRVYAHEKGLKAFRIPISSLRQKP